MRFLRCKLILSCLILFSHYCISQNRNDYFSPLSSKSYASRIAAIKARSIPVMYEDKKEQKTYAGIIKERNEGIATDLEKDRIIYDTLLLNRSKSIIQRIKSANQEFNFDSIQVYINRSPVANASCYGEGTLFINLGLFLWIDNEDELAMVIGHELSHQFLGHSETRIKKNIALFSSEEFIEEMRAIKKSSDGKYERFKKLMKDVVTESGKHSRFKESDADSMSVVLIRKAGFNVNNGAGILLKLDKTDDLFVSPGIYDVKSFFQKTNADTFIFQPKKKYNGLSSANVTMNADKAFDTVRTHPDCIVRYKQVSGKTEVVEMGCCKQINNPSMLLKERAMVEMVRNAFEMKRYTLCIHLCLFALHNNFNNPLYNTFLSLSFSGIYEADKNLERFSVTDMGAGRGSTLKDLQDFIFSANSTNIDKLARYFLDNIEDKASDNYFIAEAFYNKAVKGNDEMVIKSKFKNKFPDSKYIFLFNQ